MNYRQKIQEHVAALKSCTRASTISETSKAIAIFARLPLIILLGVLLAVYYVLLFCNEAILMPALYLEKWQEGQTGKVSGFAQGVICFFSTPIIFLMRWFSAFLSVIFFFLWFFINLVSYLLTVKESGWSPYLHEDLQPAGVVKSCSDMVTDVLSLAMAIIFTVLIVFRCLVFFGYFDNYEYNFDYYETVRTLRIIYVCLVVLTTALFKREEIVPMKQKEENVNVAE